jgi:hypothetical protein
MASERAIAGIVSALVGLGHGLGITIAADGIDAADQEAKLTTTGCEQGQGHLFGDPMLANQTKKRFARDAADVSWGHSQKRRWRGSRRLADGIDQLDVCSVDVSGLSFDPLRFTEEILECRVKGAASIRNAIIGRFLEEARSTSLLTCEDAIALSKSNRPGGGRTHWGRTARGASYPCRSV